MAAGTRALGIPDFTGHNLISAAEFLPGVGDAMGAQDSAIAFGKGDYLTGGLLGGAAAIGLVPGVGDALGGAIGGMVKAFHGSPLKGLDTLKASTKGGAMGPGTYLTPNASLAQRYAGEGGEVYTANVDDFFNGIGRLGDDVDFNPFQRYREQSERLVNAAPEELREMVSEAVKKASADDGYSLFRELSYNLGSKEAAQDLFRKAGFSGVSGNVDGPEILMFNDVPLTDARKGIRAYHGSPHDFDKFDMSKIGTGEGAQAYGHGLYFADKEDTAKTYRDMFSDIDDLPLQLDGVDIDEWANDAIRKKFAKEYKGLSRADAEMMDFVLGTLSSVRTPNDIAAALDSVGPAARRLFDKRLKGRVFQKPPVKGRMYEVNINADPDEFFDLDKRLSDYPEDVRARLGVKIDPIVNQIKNRMAELEAFRPFPGGAKGREMADEFMYLGDRLETLDPRARHFALGREEILKKAGFRGNAYLDQGSRAAGEGSRNYVVFDDKLISLIRKYGFAGAGIGAGTLIMLGGGSGDAQAGELITGQELMDRMQGGDVITGGAGDDTIKGAGEEVDYTAPAAIQNVYDAYQTGKMTPEQESEYIGDFLNGTMKAAGPLRVPDGIWKAYAAGEMDDEQRAEFEADVNAGMWERPSNESETWIGGIWNAITGEDRAVKSTEALPSWYNMPLGSLTDPKAWKASVGAFFASPEEAVKIIRTQFPDIEARQDAAGSYILKSSIRRERVRYQAWHGMGRFDSHHSRYGGIYASRSRSNDDWRHGYSGGH
jgi:hypothetical protein